MKMQTYRDFFDINEEYFPAVTKEVIDKGLVDWKLFYPHETFVKLLRTMVSVLTRAQKLGIWVEGPYGTGKSHAVLTLKKLLDASAEDIRAYFEQYKLDSDLLGQILSLKTQPKHILTVHRYGSSDIRNDANLILDIQESIRAALREQGMAYEGQRTLRDSVVAWLEDDVNRSFFNSLVTKYYATLFHGDTAEGILAKLRDFEGDALTELMNRVNKVADERGITAMQLTKEGLRAWIHDVIAVNDLKSIFFIWDEFTDYFKNNLKSLSGFQYIVETSQTEPFCMYIVTHKSAGLFASSDKEGMLTLDRFVKPTCLIELPENMAFKLMGAAMKLTDDPTVRQNWIYARESLFDTTTDSRRLVSKQARITDQELKDILPIHPYAALLLKHISTAFDSNQRSMFDFIKNDRCDEVRGFQWFIDNVGPLDENPLLTIDELWDFFYEKGKEQLASEVRAVLDVFDRNVSGLNPDQRRVLKTVLLLQAISQRAAGAEVFVPTPDNLNNAFEGTDMHLGDAPHVAEQLVQKGILFHRPLPGGSGFQFNVMSGSDVNPDALDKKKKEIRALQASYIITQETMKEIISFTGPVGLRFDVRAAAENNLRGTLNQLRNLPAAPGKLQAVVAFARSDKESAAITKLISQLVAEGSYTSIIIDASSTYLGTQRFEEYVDAAANAQLLQKTDKKLSEQYDRNARKILDDWVKAIRNGEFIVYSFDRPEGEKVTGKTALVEELTRIIGKLYPLGVEQVYNAWENMYASLAIKQGVECGAMRVTKGSYSQSNKNTALDVALGSAWKAIDPPYWIQDPTAPISKIKVALDRFIEERFDRDGQISIADVFAFLQDKPYGFVPCNLTAFTMGFLLREYIQETYRYSDGMNNDAMGVDKLKDMVDELFKHIESPSIKKYKDKYIVATTPEERAFNELTSYVFNIPLTQCTGVEKTSGHIRSKIKELAFPLWTLKHGSAIKECGADPTMIGDIIDLYTGVANNQNLAGAARTETDIAMSIGRHFLKNEAIKEALKKLFTRDNCIDGMKAYLAGFDEGILPKLANEIDDHGAYIQVLRDKFDASESTWVWSLDTVNQRIRDVILEYEIISESNRYMTKSNSFRETMKGWREKTNYIRIAFEAGKGHFGAVEKLLSLLLEISKTNTLLEMSRRSFYEELVANGSAFNQFYNDQLPVFTDVCAFQIETMPKEYWKGFYQALPLGMFTMDKAPYITEIGKRVTDYLNNMKRVQLANLWQAKSGSKSPQEWSAAHKMPVLCLVPVEEHEHAKETFMVMSNPYADDTQIQKAIDYLESASFFEALQDQAACDRAFMSTIVKDYTVLLSNPEQVRQELYKRLTYIKPYDWYGHPEVDKKLRQMAENTYLTSGSAKAMEQIDRMSADEVKKYLKRLIEGDVTIGMAILRDQK